MCDDLNLRKIVARWISHLLTTDQQKKQRAECSKDLLKIFEPDGPKCLCNDVTVEETWLYFHHIPSSLIRCGWLLMERGYLCFNRVSRSEVTVFLFFNTQGPVMVDILPQKSTFTAKVETVPLGVIKSIHLQRPTIGTCTLLLLRDNACAHKANVTVTFLKEKNIQVLAHLPTRDLVPCDV